MGGPEQDLRHPDSFFRIDHPDARPVLGTGEDRGGALQLSPMIQKSRERRWYGEGSARPKKNPT